jgi:hypothetical protein
MCSAISEQVLASHSRATKVEAKQETITHRILRSGTATGLFFLLFYLYVWLVVDPRLVYHALGILVPYAQFAFRTDGPFFLEHLARAGGLVEYGARLLSQLYAFGWVGALIATASAWCMGLLVEGLLGRGGQRGGEVLRFVPAAIVLLMYCAYSHPLGPVLSILTTVGAFVIYVRLAPVAPVQRVVTLLIVYPVLYHAAGSSSLLFAVLVVIDECLVGNRKRVAGAAVVCALVVPWAAATVYGLDLQDAYARFLLSAPGVALMRWSYTVALYLFFPTVLAGSLLWGNAQAAEASPTATAKAVVSDSKAARRPRKGGRAPVQESRPFSLRRAPAWAVTAAFFGGVGVAVWFSQDLRTRTTLEMDYYAQRERWSEVLQAAERLPKGSYSARSNRNITQALYHTGRLADEMFRYPQRPGADLFNTPDELWDLGTYFQESRLFLDLGQVNLAERCAYESLATSGEQPAVLEHLALIHVVKGQPETARMLLHSLAKHLFHRQASREMLQRLESDPSLMNDRRASQIRGNMASRDSIAQETNAEDFLQILLEKNPHNRMAFELLMADYLVNGRPQKVVANLPRLKDFAYPRIPRHYQEAVVLHSLSSNRPLPALGPELTPEVLQRAQTFQRITAGATDPEVAARGALEAGLGDSYFYYFTYGVSGR